MKNDRFRPSETFKVLYYDIIEELLFQICESNINYCVRPNVGQDEIHIAIWRCFEKYKNKALLNMSGERLDRHKLASCICGAVIEVRPLIGFKGATILKNANEILALQVGLSVIKYYMVYEFMQKADVPADEEKEIHEYLISRFEMQFPPPEENICDIQEYRDNLVNALYWSHDTCDMTHRECFHYDIWAYSKIFYHLELYNSKCLETAYEEYIKRK